MKAFWYRLIQCTWGCLQTLLGLIVFLMNFSCRHYSYHGAIITEWKNPSSVSLGMFVFVTANPYFAKRFEGTIPTEELSRRLLVHEYGHTIQSLLFGPLYLIVMGIPSTVWGFLPQLAKKRAKEKISYFTFFTEKWANHLGECATGESSIGELLID